jgi:hypothetical protein
VDDVGSEDDRHVCREDNPEAASQPVSRGAGPCGKNLLQNAVDEDYPKPVVVAYAVKVGEVFVEILFH